LTRAPMMTGMGSVSRRLRLVILGSALTTAHHPGARPAKSNLILYIIAIFLPPVPV
jgi:hypothetical protein